jgi:thiol-disulfide isomerase/thioredoxin
MKIQKIVSQLLLIFVFISIGFALGRETSRRLVDKVSGEASASVATTNPSEDNKVVVYYFYGAIRCKTCNKIEATAKEVVETQFAKELKEGRLEWKAMNFQENEELAQRYNIASSSLVIVRKQGNKDVKFENLEEVWTLVNDKPAFMEYVKKAVKSSLEGI